MKKVLKSIIALIVPVLLAVSCEEKPEWGLRLIYMPQAAIANSDLHEYPVPYPGQRVDNYTVEDGALHIALGVYRSGQGGLDAYSVEVVSDAAAAAAAVAASTETDRVVLDDSYFSVPATISVPSGERQALFEMAVNLTTLAAAHPEYSTKKLVAVISIKNPSKFELNENLSSTTVVIDGSKFIE